MKFVPFILLLFLSACIGAEHENSRLHDITIPTVQIVDNLAQEYLSQEPEPEEESAEQSPEDYANAQEPPAFNEYSVSLVYDPRTRTFAGTLRHAGGDSAPVEVKLLASSSFATLAAILPQGDLPESDIASYIVEITTPPGYTVTAPGSKSEEELEDTKITSFNASMVRSFSFSVSRYYMHVSETLPSGIVLHLYHYSQNLPIEEILREASETISFLNDTIGAYPYTHIRVVEAEMPILSVSQMVFANTSSLRTPARLRRALVQQWFGGVVASAPNCEVLISEELSDFIAALITGTVRDGIFADIFAEMGEANFIEALREYYRRFAYQTATFADFLQVAEEIHGDSLRSLS